MSYEYAIGMGQIIGTKTLSLIRPTLAISPTIAPTITPTPPVVQQTQTAIEAVQSAQNDAEVLAQLQEQLAAKTATRETYRQGLADATNEASRQFWLKKLDVIYKEIRQLENRIAIEQLPPQQRVSTITTLLQQKRQELAAEEAAYANLHVFDTSGRDASKNRQSVIRNEISRLESDLARARVALKLFLQQQPVKAEMETVFVPKLQDTAVVSPDKLVVTKEEVLPAPPVPPPPTSAEAAELRKQIEQYKKDLEAARKSASAAAAAQQKSFDAQIAQLQKELAAAGTLSEERQGLLLAQIGQLQQDKAAAENDSLNQIQTLQAQIQDLEAAKAEVEPWYMRYKWHIGLGALLVGGYLYMRNR